MTVRDPGAGSAAEAGRGLARGDSPEVPDAAFSWQLVFVGMIQVLRNLHQLLFLRHTGKCSAVNKCTHVPSGSWRQLGGKLLRNEYCLTNVVNNKQKILILPSWSSAEDPRFFLA